VKRLVDMALRDNKARPEYISSLTPIDSGYAAMGAGSLADGIFGGRTFSSGWLGYQGEDMVIEISFPSPVTLNKFSMNFLCDHVSWIFLPEEVRIEISADGIYYTTAASGHYPTSVFDQDITPVFMEFSVPPATVRKIRLTAVSMKKCPSWHRGAGMPSWIFCDEIVVE
jgi:hexosaminidase